MNQIFSTSVLINGTAEVVTSKSAIEQPHEVHNFNSFIPTNSIIVGDMKPIPNFIRQSLLASINIRQFQMKQIHPEIGVNDKIGEVPEDQEILQNITSSMKNDVSQIMISQEMETGMQHQSVILQSALFLQQEKDSKEGWLDKKSKSLFQQVKRKYCVFSEGILSVFKDEDKNRATIVLNFHLFNFRYFSKDDGKKVIEFGLKCEDDDKIFVFLGENADTWFKLLKKQIDDYRLKPKYQYYIRPFDEYYKKRLIHNNQFIDMAQTGDIILFQGKHISCKMQRAVTRSDYDHVAMILKYNNGCIYVLEATGNFGVGIFAWEHMVTRQWYELYNKVVYRQLQTKRNIEFLQKLENFTKENLGKEYKISVSKLMTDKSTILNKQHNETYFCSQLIAQAYKKAGILQTDKASTQFWPGSFSNEREDIELTNAKLSDEYVIGFNM